MTPHATRSPRDAHDVSLSQSVYLALKKAILDNQLRPGNKLTHESLAQLLGVSRTPIREALERLYQEGFVIRLPRRGFFVAEIGVVEARELYELREAVETHCLSATMTAGLTGEQLGQLEDLNDKYYALLHPGGTRERLLVDRDFHMALAGFAGNQLLLAVLDAAFERLVLKSRWDGFSMVRGAEAFREHKALLKALRAGSLVSARNRLARHIQGACSRLIAHMGSSPEPAFHVSGQLKVGRLGFERKLGPP